MILTLIFSWRSRFVRERLFFIEKKGKIELDKKCTFYVFNNGKIVIIFAMMQSVVSD